MPGQEPHGLSEAAEPGELTPQQQVPPPGLSDVSRVRRLALRAICCHTLAPGLRKALLTAAAKGLGATCLESETFQGGGKCSGRSECVLARYAGSPVTVSTVEQDTHC